MYQLQQIMLLIAKKCYILRLVVWAIVVERKGNRKSTIKLGLASLLLFSHSKLLETLIHEARISYFHYAFHPQKAT